MCLREASLIHTGTTQSCGSIKFWYAHGRCCQNEIETKSKGRWSTTKYPNEQSPQSYTRPQPPLSLFL
ncbi:uncharacterized protein LACBIDRAFT_314485 [Laccaria bicolor S238N-H82]|uniref:Predicted protein n=1 Tax=Laccaria bicolor (strain S238N-H82 / ATCC MYA-4686) TaxID=486041 RepID=B0DYN5_LACBS|nr:uncharacterized protein LACBIDRAFT_314485 [Laccaria bicolor S238N-H82]EDR00279.1 predicted protein [Laccaria bicolor S238N-H82]|eukprot:XP_001889031.1 predicted protein [Laccaria bicolor S238N-H82]